MKGEHPIQQSAAATTDAPACPTQMQWWPAWATLLMVALILCYRRPDQVLRPSFSYEAGTIFFAEDRAYGPAALTMAPAGQVGGYLVTIPRLVAFLGGFVDLSYVPAFYNLCACAFVLGVAALCLYGRWETPYRHWLALGLVLIPHGGEVFLDMNQLHFACAPALGVLILQRDATRRSHWIVDFLALTLVGLTGPFLVLLAPVLLVVRFCRGGFTRYNLALGGTAVLLAGLQLLLMWHFGRLAADLNQTSRPVAGPVEVASAESWMRVICLSLFSPFLLGNVLPLGAPLLGYMVAVTFLVCLALLAWRVQGARRWSVRILLALAGLMFLVQLYRSRSFIDYDHPFYAGQRYFYLPYLFLCWALIEARAEEGWRRQFARLGLGLMLLSAATQFTRPVLPDTRWKQCMELVKQGYEVIVPINPPGWMIRVGPNDRGRSLPPGHNVGYHPDWRPGPIPPNALPLGVSGGAGSVGAP